MRGHGRLLRGQTPQQAVDRILSEEHTLTELVEDWRSKGPTLYAIPGARRNGKTTIVQLVDEQQRTRRTLRVAWSLVALEGVALAFVSGLRLLGL